MKQKEWGIFISFRVREAVREARLIASRLQNECQVLSFVSEDSLESGDDWRRTIAKAMGEAKLMIVLATRTFGATGTSSQGTWEELVTAKTLKKPLFVIDMCEGNWAEISTLMELGNLQRKAWTPGMDMPPGLWISLLDRMQEIGLITPSARTLHNSSSSLIALSIDDVDPALVVEQENRSQSQSVAARDISMIHPDSPTRLRVQWEQLHDITEKGKAALIAGGLTALTGMALEDQLGYTEAEDLCCITEEMILSLVGVPPIQVIKLRKLVNHRNTDSGSTSGSESGRALGLVKTMTHQRRLKEHQDEIASLLASIPSPPDQISKRAGSHQFRVVSGSGDSTCRCWDLTDFSTVNMLKGHSEWVRCMAVSPDGKMVLTGSGDKTIKAWDPSSGRLLFTLTGHSYCVRKICITSDSQTVVSASYGKVLRVWDLCSGAFLRTLEGHKNTIHSLIMTKDSRFIISGSDDTTLKVWNISTGECKVTLKGHKSTVNCLSLSLDGRTVVSGSDDKTVRSWSLVSEASTIFRGHEKSVTRVECCPDGMLIVSGSLDSNLRVWSMESGACVAVLRGHTEHIQSLAVAQCAGLGLFAVSGSQDKTLRVWNLGTMECHHVLKGHVGAVHCVVITPDGKTIVSGSLAKRLRVWDLESGICRATMEGHTGPVNCLALIPILG